MNNKYELIPSNKTTPFGAKLFRIKAKISFGNVSKGDLGGYIESEKNLEVSGNAWVYGDARVYGNARVYGKLKLSIGFYFGFLSKNEKIKKIKLEDGNYLISK